MGSQALPELSSKKILISELDFKRLSSLFENCDEKEGMWVDDLDDKLINAKIVAAQQVPSNLVTMNSSMTCVMTNQQETFALTLVYPLDADIGSNRVSVLSQVGRALLGRRIGEIVTWKGNDGFLRRMKLEKMEYQPEQSGDWNL